MKKIILIIIVIFVTGCQAEVNINISENEVSENIKIYDLKENVFETGTNVKEEVNNNVVYFEHDYKHYDIEEFEENRYVGKNYKFTSDLNLLGSSISRLTTCYENIEVYKNSYMLNIKTSDEYRCGYIFGANDVVLNIISDLKVSKHNADKVEDNKYIWNINSNNYKNKPIKIYFELSNEENSEEQNQIENVKNIVAENEHWLNYILGVIGVVVIFIGVYVYIKIKNSNK